MDLFGSIFMALVWILVIVGIVAAVRRIMHGTMKNVSLDHTAPDPLNILKTRYARGEISTEVFEERKRLPSNCG